MKNAAFNPYLPGYEYVPDAEPRIFGDRLYVFGSHDRSHGTHFCQRDYVCWSAATDDLGNWRYEGVIYEKTQDPLNHDGSHQLYAPDVIQGADGRYYLYYCLDIIGRIAVAVCDEPAGKYTYYGEIHYPDGKVLTEYFPGDPAALNDDGKIYIYYGFCPTVDIPVIKIDKKTGSHVVRLDSDMLTILEGPEGVLPYRDYTDGTGFEGHGFFEASSIRKFEDRYYYVYASEKVNELCYAVSLYPDRDFHFEGTLISNGDIGYKGRLPEERLCHTGNIHGGMVKIGEQYYIFYHRHTQGTLFSRQGCAEPLFMDENGRFAQVEMTSAGLNGGVLKAEGQYPAMIACNIVPKDGASDLDMVGLDKSCNPYIEESIPDGNNNDSEQYIANLRDGDKVTFKYFQFEQPAVRFGICLRGTAKGRLIIRQQGCTEEAVRFELDVPGDMWKDFSVPAAFLTGKYALDMIYSGTGYLDIKWFAF